MESNFFFSFWPIQSKWGELKPDGKQKTIPEMMLCYPIKNTVKNDRMPG